jgi:hypothetical protein
MRDVALLGIHLLVTFVRLLRPNGVRAVAAESLLLKHQLLISNRSRRRAPNLTSIDRLVLGLTTQFVSPRRIPKLSVILNLWVANYLNQAAMSPPIQNQFPVRFLIRP